ncbi:hypothetical protein [Halarcobacter ebronensis]|uniref:Uncharacterized protein n=1 Tax=Halarcobacter ebronensis TaxID=1462615 RepID=A0A4Q1ALE3_9BACT|nr:hypothetical protein [Halarcobacter ebronensis]QKF83381.1 hypothetical protein AEBR_2930 [Halarcobacter ebronensis]RXK05941.1 hypothetical protein CRV07_07670 [Halarcobacter ebronensis]
MTTYTNELEGQTEFYTTFLKRVNNKLTLSDILSDNNDGVLNGNLLEFKLVINDLNSVLFQAIKYLSAMRMKGKSVPANIILISLNDHRAYIYSSKEYLYNIEQVYIGSASKNNIGFQAITSPLQLNYSSSIEAEKLVHLLKTTFYTRINIDENCIVGWASRYYRENPEATKSGFIGDETGETQIVGEIRKPEKFKEFINPYKGESNIKFQYLMDKLNDEIQKKNLGAFYTPSLYVKKSIELVREAIRRVPEGNDYIILDRCAGTGNLELELSDEELSHCIVSTYEYYEYKVLMELIGDKVLHIIPPFEVKETFNNGTVRGADALSKEYLNIDIIKQYIDNPKCTIILYENPPYAETTSMEHQRQNQGKKSSAWKKGFVVQEMKKEVSGVATNDLANAFIWSAFKYYLRQETDSYIVFSPVKYWKSQHLIEKEFLDGFAFNRKHFHTNTNACIMCALWSNKNKTLKSISLKAVDIKDNESVVYPKKLKVDKVFTLYSKRYYEKRKFEDDVENGIVVGLNGTEDTVGKIRISPKYNKNILGYLVADSTTFDNPDAKSSLVIAGRYNGNGFFLRKDNFLEKLPMFAASRYINYNREWTERGRIMKSADGSVKFLKDIKNKKIEQYLLKCLLFTTLEMQNHMRTFIGSDNRFYRNELCLDISNGETIASSSLSNLKLTDVENNLLQQWNIVLNIAMQTKNYDNTLTYGVYQIFDELNTFHRNDLDKKVFDYPELNGHLNTLKTLVKNYYNQEIVPTLFEYQFLK